MSDDWLCPMPTRLPGPALGAGPRAAVNTAAGFSGGGWRPWRAAQPTRPGSASSSTGRGSARAFYRPAPRRPAGGARTRLAPSNSADTMVAKKWRPSPSTSRCSQARPCAMKRCDFGGGRVGHGAILGDAAVSAGSCSRCAAGAAQTPQTTSEARADDRQAQPRRHVADAEEAAAEAVDHVEERVQVAHRLPERRQRVHRIEHAGEEGHRHDDEVLERRDLVELLGPQPGDQPQRAHHARRRSSAKTTIHQRLGQRAAARTTPSPAARPAPTTSPRTTDAPT